MHLRSATADSRPPGARAGASGAAALSVTGSVCSGASISAFVFPALRRRPAGLSRRARQPSVEVGAALADRDARALAADRGADARLGEVERDAGKNLDALSEKECHGCSGSLFAGRIQARTAQACAARAQ